MQIYVKTYNNVSALLVGEGDKVYWTSYEKSEINAIRRGASYAQNILKQAAEIFPDTIKGKDVFKDEYLKRLKIPVMLGTELTKNEKLSNQCLQNLNIELRFNNLRKYDAMER